MQQRKSFVVARSRITKQWFAFTRYLKPRSNATCRNIVGRNMLRDLANMLRYVGCCWLKFENDQIFTQHLWMLWSFGPVRATMLRQGIRTSSIFNSQHSGTRCNNGSQTRATCCTHNVAICCVEMLRSFGRGLQILGQQCCDVLRWTVAIVWPGL